MFKLFFRKKVTRSTSQKVRRKRALVKKRVSDFDKSEVEVLRKNIYERLEFYKSFYYEHGIDLEWNRVSIKNNRRSWGSCSSKKNLNFNIKMKSLSDELFDYVIVHEMCHLVHMNHKEEFWKLVSVAVPDYLKSKSKLKVIRF